MKAITIGVTGGSGSVYAVRLLQILPYFYEQVNVVFSNTARVVLQEEMQIEAPKNGEWKIEKNIERNIKIALGDTVALQGKIVVWENQNYNAPFASGSGCAEQMVIVPCSMSTAAAIAHGIDMNLLHHASAVAIKEKKQLIVVPRETPLSSIHLQNLLNLSQSGVTVIPAMPGFYSGQETFDDLINFVVQKIVNHLGIKIQISKKWRE